MIKKTIFAIIAIISLSISFPFSTFAAGGKEVAFTPVEIVELRTENSKTTQIGTNKYSSDTSVGVMHYKDNYSNANEQWKDIDLTMINGRVDKAPYTLVLDGKKITVTDKKSGSVTTLELTSVETANLASKTIISTPSLSFAANKATASNIATDTDLELSWENSRISYTRILKSVNAPTTAKFNVTQTGSGITLLSKAQDSKTSGDREIAVTSYTDKGVLTENIDSRIAVTYPLRVDPTVDISIGSSTDDATKAGTQGFFTNLTYTYMECCRRKLG
jgi:hypothetical protein